MKILEYSEGWDYQPLRTREQNSTYEHAIAIQEKQLRKMTKFPMYSSRGAPELQNSLVTFQLYVKLLYSYQIYINFKMQSRCNKS